MEHKRKIALLFVLYVLIQLGPADAAGTYTNRHFQRREKPSLNIYSSLESSGVTRKYTAPYPEGVQLNLTCQNAGSNPSWFNISTQLSKGKHEADYSIDSLTAGHHGLTLSCGEKGSTKVNIAINVLSVPLLNMSYVVNGTTVPMTNHSVHDLHSSGYEIHCRTNRLQPEIKLCLEVGQDKRCRISNHVSLDRKFKKSRKLNARCYSTLNNSAIIDNLVPNAKDMFQHLFITRSVNVQLKLNDAAANVSDGEDATHTKTTEKYKPSNAGKVTKSTVTISTAAAQMDLTDPISKTTEKAVLLTAPILETPPLLPIVLSTIAGFFAIILIILVIFGFMYRSILRRVPSPTPEGVQNADECLVQQMPGQNNVENHSYYYPVLHIQPRNCNEEIHQYEDVGNYQFDSHSYYYPNLIL